MNDNNKDANELKTSARSIFSDHCQLQLVWELYALSYRRVYKPLWNTPSAVIGRAQAKPDYHREGLLFNFMFAEVVANTTKLYITVSSISVTNYHLTIT